MVTVIGSVLSRNDSSLDPSDLYRFAVEIYDISKAVPVSVLSGLLLGNHKPLEERRNTIEMDTTPPEPRRGGRDLHTEHNTESPATRPFSINQT